MVFIETVFAAALNMQMADWLSYICSQLYYIWFQMWYMHHVIIQPCQTCHNNSLNHSTITMKALSVAQHNHILSLLDSGHSGHEISSQTGVSNATISRLYSRHHPYHKKASGSCPSKLSEQDLHYATQLIGTGSAVQVAKSLQDSTNQPLSTDCTKSHEESEDEGCGEEEKATSYQAS